MFLRSATAGGILFVVGTAGRDEAGRVVEGDAPQTVAALEGIERVLRSHGRDRSAIVRLRIYVVDMRRWPTMHHVIGAFFDGSIPPCSTVGVTGLAEPDMVIEIDAEASVA